MRHTPILPECTDRCTRLAVLSRNRIGPGSVEQVIQQALLVFDGGCGFCTRAARWVERRWPSGLGEAVPSHELSDEELMGRGLSRSAVAEQVWWVGPEGNLGGAAAVARALSTTAGPWRYLGWAISRPPLAWLAPTGYRFVARHRHRLPGSSEACKV